MFFRQEPLPGWCKLLWPVIFALLAGCASPGKFFIEDVVRDPDGTQKVVSRGIADMVDRIDRIMGEPRIEDRERIVRVRLGGRVTVEEGGNQDVSILATGRIPLPALERKANVFLDLGGSADSASDFGDLDLSDQKTSYRAGLSFIRLLPDEFVVGASTGLFWHSGIQTFIRPFLRYEDRRDPWRFFAEQGLFYDTDKGFGEKTIAHVDYIINPSLFFRVRSSAELFQEAPGLEIDHTLILRQRFIADSVLSYEIGADYNTGPPDDEDVDQDESFVQVRWRGRVWHPWLEYELKPRVTFPWDPGQDVELSCLFGLNILFEDYLRPAGATNGTP